MATLDLTKQKNDLTTEELNAPGGMTTIQGGYASGYNPPPPKPPSNELQQTTTEQRNQTADRMEDFTQMTANRDAELERIRQEALAIQETLNKRQAEEQAGQTTDTTGDTTDTTGDTGETGGIDSSIQDVKDQMQQDIDDYEAGVEEIQAHLDASYRMLVQHTKKVYEDRAREMEKANQRQLDTKTTIGIRTGRSRYAPVVQEGILQQEEIEGIQRITTLNNKLNLVLAQAADAKAQNDLKLFNASYDRIAEIKKEAQETIVKLYEQANEELELQQKAEKEARLADKEALDLMIKKADQAAPAIAVSVGELATPEEQAEFLNLMAERLGITPEYLYGSVVEASDEATKRQLDNENTRSLIGTRAQQEERARDKYDQEQQDREDKDTLRQEIVTKLDNGTITIEQARTAWGMVFPLDEFEKEFTGYIDEL